jgi:putative N6-adenine methyltransferase
VRNRLQMWHMCRPETDLIDVSYRDRVDHLVRTRLGDGKPHIWEDLVRSLSGVDPSTVLDALRRYGLTRGVDFNGRPTVAAHATGRDDGLGAYDVSALPTPHPLDYCWWFDAATVNEIVSLVQRLTSPRAHVALLGTPTIFNAVTSAHDKRKVSLIDADPLLVNGRNTRAHGREVFLADLTCCDLDIERANIVVADPPWYEAETRAFLWMARQLCDIDGVVLVSAPGEETRPGIAAEWVRMMDWAETLGLALEEHQRGVLSYVSPLFEQNALIAASVPPPRVAWRCGNLLRFRCVDMCHAERPKVATSIRWCERVFGDVRIRVRQGANRAEWRNPTLKRMTESDILPTVSRRDRRRDFVDVWTTGNRVFRCDGTEVLLNILDAMIQNERTMPIVGKFFGRDLTKDEERDVRQTEEKLREIIRIEGTEVSTWREHHARVDVVTG